MAGLDERGNCLSSWSWREWPAHINPGRTKIVGFRRALFVGENLPLRVCRAGVIANRPADGVHTRPRRGRCILPQSALFSRSLPLPFGLLALTTVASVRGRQRGVFVHDSSVSRVPARR